MRRLIRPVVLVVLVCGLSAAVHSQDTGTSGNGYSGPGTGFNMFFFNNNSPAATTSPGGLSVSLTAQPLPGWNVNYIEINIIDACTLDTVASQTITNPPVVVNQTFWDLQSKYPYNICVISVFQYSLQFQTFTLTGTVTTN